MKKNTLLLLTMFLSFSAFSQQQQLQLKTENFIVLTTKNIAMVLSVEENKDVNMIYLGDKLENESDYKLVSGQYKQAHDYTNMYQSAYTSSGTRNLLEPAISVEHSDGNQSLDLKYVSHAIKTLSPNQKQVTVVLKDEVYPFSVELHYLTNFEQNVIEQWSVINHQEKKPVKLVKYASANLSVKGSDFYLRHYHGDWISEMQPETHKLTHGIKTLDSKLGARTNLFQSSYFALAMDEPMSEDKGTVLMGGLEWSGNFRVDFEKDPQDNLRIIAGINNYASHYQLQPNTPFQTPRFSFTLSKQGLGEGSRNLHKWARENKLIDGQG
ncbi:MAG: glycoside hydrolase family 36 N-terminal domain-containing protein, partial [Sphingobacterium sp.]